MKQTLTTELSACETDAAGKQRRKRVENVNITNIGRVDFFTIQKMQMNESAAHLERSAVTLKDKLKAVYKRAEIWCTIWAAWKLGCCTLSVGKRMCWT